MENSQQHDCVSGGVFFYEQEEEGRCKKERNERETAEVIDGGGNPGFWKKRYRFGGRMDVLSLRSVYIREMCPFFSPIPSDVYIYV